MIVLALVLFGLLFGSFINAFVWRLHEGRNWVNERSECTHCHHVLAAKDLVPVLSWVWLRGKCRYCHKPIDDNPLVELTLPLLFVASYLWWPLPLHGQGLFDFIVWLLLLIGFVILAVYDLRWLLLPNVVVFPVIGVSAAYVLSNVVFFHAPVRNLLQAALGVVIVSGLFWVLFQVSKGRWIGFGDVKLAIALGLLAGTPAKAVLLLFFASFLGTLVALPLVAAGQAGRKTKLPFGPLLLAATVLVQLFGSDVIDWYTGLFL